MNGPASIEPAPRPASLPAAPARGHDVRSLVALLVVGALVAWGAYRSAWFAWVSAIVAALAAVRALAYVVAARGAGVDPEAKKVDAAKGSSTPAVAPKR